MSREFASAAERSPMCERCRQLAKVLGPSIASRSQKDGAGGEQEQINRRQRFERDEPDARHPAPLFTGQQGRRAAQTNPHYRL